MEVAVQHLLQHRAGGHTNLHTEHFNQWQQEIHLGEQSKNLLWRELWMCLVDLVNHRWRMGEIPQELGWMTLFLIPKGTTNTRGIGLLQTLWKLVGVLMDTSLHARLQIHDVLHGFRSGRGTGSAIMDLKIDQEFASIDQDPLFLLQWTGTALSSYCRGMERLLECVGSWRLSGTFSRWHQGRTASTDRPSLPQGVKYREDSCPRRCSM